MFNLTRKRHSRCDDPDVAPRLSEAAIIALLGVMIRALLAALLGRARAQPRAIGVDGVMAGVLRSEAEAEMTLEPYVEWVAVPAPWRNGRLLPKRHARVPGAQMPAHGVRLAALVRGPPLAV
ncbi:MAG: hypothetical protein NT133_13510 [Alphaproteobacteria bacterium]|nr:hypothetical protein [Alphaproteobacteria bacterium]